MTVKELYSFCLNILKNSDIDDYRFDCDCLFEKFLDIDKVKRITRADIEVIKNSADELLNAVKRRAEGEPLQYILGQWSFFDSDFYVGKGVLIPRPETEMLVELANKKISESGECVIYDLCAGSGAIGLSIAKHNPECTVYLFEKYDEAFYYLEKNKEALNLPNTEIIKCDIFDNHVFSIQKADIIVSNPPYIKKEEIASLQSEVLREPLSALDGGDDGLVFYRCIHDQWLSGLNDNGVLFMECGDDQSADIISCFSDVSKKSVVHYDFNHIDRIVEINV